MKLFSVLFSVLYVSHSALGQDVTVQVGAESVSLPCSMTALKNEPSAEWRRVGSSSEIVHLKVEEGDDLRSQSSLFRGRTSMKPDALQTGDLRLVLSKPTQTDTGTYSCAALSGITEVERKTVTLTVTALIVTADEGDDFVSLPVHIPMSLLSSKSSVEWRRGTETVHLREQQGDDLRGQSDEFKDRTEMNPKALQTGDLRLVLSKPRVSDTGTYSCVVRDDSTEMKRTSVELRVVEAPPVPVGPVVGAVFAVVVVAAAAAVAALTLTRKKETKESFSDAFVGVIKRKPKPSSNSVL